MALVTNSKELIWKLIPLSPADKSLGKRTGKFKLLEDGTLEGCVIECGLHFGSFDVRTGAVLAAPCTRPLRTYPVQICDGAVWLDLGEKA